MDLVTLVTACALTVDPKLMHALIWHSSGGEPWAISVQGEANPRVFPDMRDAIWEARSGANRGTVRVGLAGVAVSPPDISPSVLRPCRNIAMAAEQIAGYLTRCKSNVQFKNDPMFCAVAVYLGSWQQPDVKFATAVMASFAKGDAPDFDMPPDTSTTIFDTVDDQPSQSGPPIRDVTVDVTDRMKSWSSALFPPKPVPSTNKADGKTSAATTTDEPSSVAPITTPPLQPGAQDRDLFVPRSRRQQTP